MNTAEFDQESRNDPLFLEYQRARDLLKTQDWRLGLEELELLAHRGSIMSTLLVSDAMRVGWMYDQDLIGAGRWYRVAYESGSLRGLFGLGLTHLAMERYEEALEELHTATVENYAPAFNALAGMYFRGDGVEVDRKRAEQLWQEGASRGHVPARVNLVKQQMQGSYGALGRLKGAINILPTAIALVSVRSETPYTDRLR